MVVCDKSDFEKGRDEDSKHTHAIPTPRPMLITIAVYRKGTLVTLQRINSGVTQQCNMSPYFYAIDWPE